MNLYEKVKCICGKEVERIDLFPGDICISCYEKTPGSKKEYTNDLFINSINK